MQISSLEYFIDVADAGSYYQAEKVYGEISAQAYSKAVRSLEREIGTKLVVASRRGVELTSDGAVFLKFARATIDGYASMQAKLRHSLSPATSKPPVLFATFYAAAVLTELISLGYFPGGIQIREMPFESILDRCPSLQENEIALVDLQDGGASIDLKERGLSFKGIIESRPMAVVSGESPFAKLGRSLEIQDLRSASIMCNSHPEMMHKYRALLDLLPEETMVSSFSSVRGLSEYLIMNPDLLCLADSVQGMLLANMEHSNLEGFVFMPIDSHVAPTKLGVLRKAGTKKSREANQLVRTLSEAFGRLAAGA